jgi:hypothetical protein
MASTKKNGTGRMPPPAVGVPGARAGAAGLPAELQDWTPPTASGGPAGPGSPGAAGGDTTATSPSIAGQVTNDAEPGGGTAGPTPDGKADGRA